MLNKKKMKPQYTLSLKMQILYKIIVSIYMVIHAHHYMYHVYQY